MERLRASTLASPARWKEILLLASVAIAVAASVAFTGIHLRKQSETAGVRGLDQVDSLDGLPDVMGNRCLNEAAQPL